MIDNSCRRIFEELDIRFFVETGTDMAETVCEVAGWFSDMDPEFGKVSGHIITGARSYNLGSEPIKYPVFEGVGDSRYKLFSVDVDRRSFENARELFKANRNIQLFCEDSPECLKKFVDAGAFEGSDTTFFLDAHWGKYWPLRDELKQIIRLERFVVVIDDFFVPGRSSRAHPRGDFGFDFYGGRVLCWDYVCDLFCEIDVKVYYPVRSNRDRRGFVLLFKGYTSEALDFLRDIGFEFMAKDDPVHRGQVALSPRAHFDFRYLARSIIPLPLLRSGIRTLQKLTHR